MVKRIVITVTHAELHASEGTWTYCIPMTDAYCKLHNIQFEHVVLKTIPEDRGFSWTKIPVIRTFIDHYDEILFISENATIINQRVEDIFDYIKSAPKESKWVEPFQPILYALTDKSKGNPLSGIFLIDCRNKASVLELLDDWWNDVPNPDYKTVYPFEQETIASWKSNPKKAARIQVADVWSIQEYDKDQVFIQITNAYKNIQIYETKKYMFRTLNNKHKKIGIFVRQNNYYCSGAGQNCIFIKHSLEAAGYHVDLLIDYDPSKSSVVDTQIPYIFTSTKNIKYEEYSFILYGWYIPLPETRLKIRECGIKTAMFHPMNSFDAIHNDHFIHNTDTSVPLFEENFHNFADEIWLTRNHDITYKLVLEIQNKHKIPVRIVPLSWAPLFTLYNGVQYKYPNNDNATKLDIIIMEPNASYCKNAWMPLVITEAFYLKHKEKLNKVYLFGRTSEEGNIMIQSLSIHKDSKLRKIGRTPINEILKFFCHTEPNNKVAVISHNIQCPLNYAYYDVMNAGFPFLHNSPNLNSQKLGYAYSNVSEGVKQLEYVFLNHDHVIYKKPINDLLATIDPYSESVFKIFESYVKQTTKEQVQTPLNACTIHGCIISTFNAKRYEFMNMQMAKFPYPYSFFKAFTKENSTEYFDVQNPIEPDLLLLCMRSHIGAMEECIRTTSAEYFLIMEEDVAFQKCDLHDKLQTIVSKLRSNTHLDYISLSYQPACLDKSQVSTKLHMLNRDDTLYWGFDKPEVTFTIWGSQAYVIPRIVAQKLVSLLHHSKLSNVQKNYYIYLQSNKTYAKKVRDTTIDAIMPLMLNQGILYPMLCVEKYFTDSISNSSVREKEVSEYCSKVDCKYNL